jgi:tetratricopeptide (TPR) repeat protein
MRKTCIAALTAASVAASASAASPAAPFGAITSETATATTAAPPMVATAATTTPSWKERLLTPFKRNPFAALSTTQQPAPQQAAAPADPPIDPKSATPELFIGLAQMSHRAGNVAQARQYYQQAIALSPTHLEALLGAARMEDREGQLDVAQMLYQRAVAAYPSNATALNDLGLCLARRGDLQGARQVLQQAVQIEPAKPLYRNNIAKVLVELNQQNEALSQLSAVHPAAAAQYNLGILLTQRGRDREAIQCFIQANKLDPSFEPARIAVMQKTGSAVMPPAVDRSIAGGGQLGQLIDSNSILPTPQALATVPWKSPQSYEAAIQPSAPGQPAVAVETPATSPTPAPNNPALLPPVN